MTSLNRILPTLLVAVAVTSCTKKEPNVELIQDMMESPAVKAQDYNPRRSGEMANMVPPEGTVAVGHAPYKYKGKPEDAERALTNPLEATEAVLARGKMKFETYCFPCHGSAGDGKGPVAPKFMVPVPSLLTDKAKAYRDGRLFHIITDGQGVMGSYASQIKDQKDRWAIVHYIRSLQKK
ncbi:MAG: cytochrome c [Bdellovibrionales bacterium]